MNNIQCFMKDKSTNKIELKIVLIYYININFSVIKK